MAGLRVSVFSLTVWILAGAPMWAQGTEWISSHDPGSPGVTAADAYLGPAPFQVASRDGRYVVFHRDVDSSTGPADVFVRDRHLGRTELISVSASGTAGNARSLYPSISDDGRFVLFSSWADNLVAADGNGSFDVFLRDRELGQTRAISRSRFGSGTANGVSLAFALSGDGSVALFQSLATDLVSEPTSFVELFLADLGTGEVRMLTLGRNGIGQGISFVPAPAALSDDGRRVVFTVQGDGMVADDANGQMDLFLLDRDRDEIRLLTRRLDGTGSASGGSGTLSVTPDGRYATFQSAADDLVPDDSNGLTDVFRVDLDTGEIRLVSVDSQGRAGSGSTIFSGPPVSDSGRFVAFQSRASLLPEDTDGGAFDVYVRDLERGESYLVSEDGAGNRDHRAMSPFLSPDGTRVGFTSHPIDGGEPSQILVRRLPDGPLRLVGGAGDRNVGFGRSTPDGNEVVFFSRATHLGGGGGDDVHDVFVAPLPVGVPLTVPAASDISLLILLSALLGFGLRSVGRNKSA